MTTIPARSATTTRPPDRRTTTIPAPAVRTAVDPPEEDLAALYAAVDDYLRADDPGDDPALLAALDDEYADVCFEHLYLHTIVNPAEYWLRIDERADSEVPARVEGLVDGQTISVSTDNVTELTVLLADELLDLDQPLTVELDGEVWFAGSVERDPYLAVTSARERSERSMVFAVRLSGDVPGEGRPAR